MRAEVSLSPINIRMFDRDKIGHGCPMADNNAWQRPDGEYIPCCNYSNNIDSIGIHTDIASFHSSLGMRRLREDLDNGIRRPGCVRCWEIEDAGGISIRQGSHLRWPDKPPPAIRGIEISTGRTCTLKCRTCSSWQSTAWESEDRRRGIMADLPTADSRSIDFSVFENVTEIKVTGGEPFLSKSFAKLLGDLANNGMARNIRLEIYTNCVDFPSSAYTDSMGEFRRALVLFSLDGVGARNDYIRTGSSWEGAMDTISRWADFRDSSRDGLIGFGISHTFSTFNMLYLDEMLDFIPQLDARFGLNLSPRMPHLAAGVVQHSIKMLPAALRHRMADMHAAGMRGDAYDEFRRVVVDVLRANHPEPRITLRQWLEKQGRLDSMRGQDMRTALPELATLLDEYVS